jgi:amino acid transporter
LIRHLSASKPEEFSTIAILIISFLLTISITALFAFVGFVYPTNRMLPNKYYEIRKPEALVLKGRVLGIKYVKCLLLFTF